MNEKNKNINLNFLCLDGVSCEYGNICFEDGELKIEILHVTEAMQSNLASLSQKWLHGYNITLSIGNIMKSVKLQQISCSGEVGEIGLYFVYYWNITKCEIHIYATYQLWYEINEYLSDTC